MTNPLITYLHQTTLPLLAPVLAVVPKTAAPQADKPVTLCSRYLGTRVAYKPNGTSYVQQRWSHAIFQVTGYYVRIEDGNRSYIVNADTIRMENKEAA